ncbi:MAG: hypothetical protein K5829_13150 [Treponema sp.]|nr:hypothetical protein [Treponema sp.]
MKKIVLGIAALAMATSMFAVDFAARVYMTGTVADGVIDINDKAQDNPTKDSTLNFWNLSKTDQKDADALVMSVNGEKSGAAFQFWYNYDGSGSAALNVRSSSIWFKPIDMLKITVGDVSVGTYKESIDWWKAPVGNSSSDFDSWGGAGKFSSYATVEGAGLSIEATPVDGLWLNAGIVNATGENFAKIAFDGKSEDTYASWGFAAKYDFAGLLGLPLSTAVSYRDKGLDNYKVAAIGAEYGNRWGDGFYGFLNTRFYFGKDSITDPASNVYTMKNVALTGIAFDNMLKYQAGQFQIMARLPVIIRGIANPEVDGVKLYDTYKSKDCDPSYMCYEIKATYPINAFTVYLDIENDNAVTFNDDFGKTFLKMSVQPGATFNVGTCALDLGLKITVPNEEKSNLSWSIPFTASVAF